MQDDLLDKLLIHLEKNELIPKGQYAIYHYSLEVSLSLISFWLMMAAFMLIFDSVWPTLLYLGIFCFFRSTIGGYHAQTHGRCLALSAVMYLLFIWSYTYLLKTWLLILSISIVASITVLLLAPVEHPNKPFSPIEQMRYRKQSCHRAVIFLLGQLLLATLDKYPNVAFCLAFGACQAAFSLLITYFQRKG